eukprot:1157899-Pelagomonas_calceolata.AAC.3
MDPHATPPVLLQLYAKLEELVSLMPAEYQVKIKQIPPEILLSSIILVAVFFLLLVLRALSRPSKSTLPPVLLVGPCGAGKTALFFALRDASLHNGTVASMQENEGMVQLQGEKGSKKGQARLLDVPGHERLRHKLEQHLSDACAVVFVVDATDITPHKHLSDACALVSVVDANDSDYALQGEKQCVRTHTHTHAHTHTHTHTHKHTRETLCNSPTRCGGNQAVRRGSGMQVPFRNSQSSFPPLPCLSLKFMGGTARRHGASKTQSFDAGGIAALVAINIFSASQDGFVSMCRSMQACSCDVPIFFAQSVVLRWIASAPGQPLSGLKHTFTAKRHIRSLA